MSNESLFPEYHIARARTATPLARPPEYSACSASLPKHMKRPASFTIEQLLRSNRLHRLLKPNRISQHPYDSVHVAHSDLEAWLDPSNPTLNAVLQLTRRAAERFVSQSIEAHHAISRTFDLHTDIVSGLGLGLDSPKVMIEMYAYDPSLNRGKGTLSGHTSPSNICTL